MKPLQSCSLFLIWQIVKNSDKEEDVEYFMQKFPKSSCIEAAQKRIHEIRAVNHYKNGDLAKAYDEFNSAGGRNYLQNSNQSLYDKCLEFTIILPLLVLLNRKNCRHSYGNILIASIIIPCQICSPFQG